MRVAVVGATGNVGTSVLHSLAPDPDIWEGFLMVTIPVAGR